MWTSIVVFVVFVVFAYKSQNFPNFERWFDKLIQSLVDLHSKDQEPEMFVLLEPNPLCRIYIYIYQQTNNVEEERGRMHT